jgi:hypothetical protein
VITPIHLAFDYIIYLIFGNFIKTNVLDLILLFSVSLIDLDHLFSKPIYKFKRNPFKTHFLHKQWKFVLIIALLMLLVRPIMFLGIGLMSHFFLDWIYVKMFFRK